jgi:hypothetical protein
MELKQPDEDFLLIFLPLEETPPLQLSLLILIIKIFIIIFHRLVIV